MIAVVGATASGKSALALDLSAALTARGVGEAEIVNADAMALYRGMDIGTASPSPEDRARVRHHQVDVLAPDEEASVAAFQREARRDVDAVMERGGWAIVVGGSGLYLRALLDELEFPGTDPQVRAALEARAAADGIRTLHDELARRDPPAAAAIDPRNERRVIRALEVMEVTGAPFTATLPSGRYRRETVAIGLAGPWAWLDERIARRTTAMVQAGLVREVAGLGPLSATAARATGYAEAARFLTEGGSEEDLTEAIAAQTRRLARRQMKWFRRDARIAWIDPTLADPLPAALGILDAWRPSAS